MLSYSGQNYKSKFSQHFQNSHSIGPIEDVMKVMQFVNKNNFMNILEECYIQKETYKNSKINGRCTFIYKKFFQTIVQHM
jgi:hypothetical protein